VGRRAREREREVRKGESTRKRVGWRTYLAELLKAGTRDRGVEVDALVERVDLNRRLRRRRQRPLGSLSRRPQSAERAGVVLEGGREGGRVKRGEPGERVSHPRALASCPSEARAERTHGDVALVLALELLDEMVDEAVVKVLAAEVRVAGGRLDLEDALLDRQERDVKRAAAEVKDEDVLLAELGRFVESVGDRAGAERRGARRFRSAPGVVIEAEEGERKRGGGEGTHAAVGSLMMRRTLRPAMMPASLVAWRCESLK